MLFSLLFLIPAASWALNLTKCCPDHQAFDTFNRRCFDWAPHDDLTTDDYPIDPAVTDYYYDDAEEQSEATQYKFVRTELLECNQTTSFQHVVINHEHRVGLGSFYYDTYGDLLVDSDTTREHKEFCLDRAFRGRNYIGTAAIVCQEREEVACARTACIRSCCKPPDIYDLRHRICREPDEYSMASVFKPMLTSRETGYLTEPPADTLFLYGSPTCSIGAFIFNLTKDTLVIQDNGNLVLGSGRILNHTEYCVNHVEEKTEGESYFQKVP